MITLLIIHITLMIFGICMAKWIKDANMFFVALIPIFNIVILIIGIQTIFEPIVEWIERDD